MCDPIITQSINIETEPFSKEAVNEYLEKRTKFTKYFLRHYSQTEVNFEPSQIEKILVKLKIPINGTKVTVFGGYTGEFANCLRNMGMNVIFTDPLEEWVVKAKEEKFEAYQFSAEQTPKELLLKTDLFATFECYPPFANDSSALYTILRFLTTENGILFAASTKTYSEIKMEKKKVARMKSYFLPFKKVYGIERLEKGREGLKLYHFYSTNRNQQLRMDCKLIKALYDNFPNEASINQYNILSLLEHVEFLKNEVIEGLRRILSLYQLNLDPILKPYIPENSCRFFSKIFYIDL